jgi:serine protease Do
MKQRRLLVVAASSSLLVAACGGGDDPVAVDSVSTTVAAPTPTEATAPTTTPTTTAAPVATTAAAPVTTAEPEGISSFSEVQPAIVQIVAKGTFRDPEVGMQTGAGSGSGFVISPDGYAVTNNHVVTGAASLEVFLGGDTSESYNAQIVGVSECNDLALIKISGADFEALTWTDGAPTVGQEIYAAGFPLGDPEYTLTRGIVSKADADGETPWSSIDRVIQHDAQTQPGNSGGPLVSAEGQVVGVHYASGDWGTGTSQFFAISSELAQGVVDKLYDGDFESLGINGSAVNDGEGTAGVWVAAVAAGSPASQVGLLPGDIVTALNGLPLGSDGTMKDYCDVIRTAGEGEPMAIEVLRFDSQEVLRGEINNPDKALTLAFSFAEEIETSGEAPVEEGTAHEYVSLVDDTGRMTVDVPASWTDVDTAPRDGAPWISASTNLAELSQSWLVPGMFAVGVEGPLDFQQAITEYGIPEGTCLDDTGNMDYDDGLYVGLYEIWFECGDTTTGYAVVAATDPEGAWSFVLAWQFITTADLDAFDQAIRTIYVTN